nr:facilitated trehalose transporter Tret1-like [Leptinotarsa decemlineata]
MGVLASVNTKKSSGSRIYQYIAAITANLGIICSEMHYGWPSPFVPTLQSGQYHFQISSEEGSWLVVAPLVGAIFGAFVTALIVDRFGRKRLIIFSSLPFVTSWLLIGFADSSTLMFVGRVLAGAADGLSFTAGSIRPNHDVINIFGAYLALDTVAYIGTIFPILLLVTFSWMPESPYYLLMHGRTVEARKSLQTFRGVEEVTKELTRISGAIQEQADNRGSVFDLVTVKSNRKGLFITLGLRGIQQLSGTTAIIFYCKTIFKEAEGFISSSLATIIYFSVQLFLSALTSFVVDISGRRPLLIVSTTGTALTLLLNGVFLYLKNCTEVDTSSFDFVPLIALLCFVIVFSVGLQTIPLLVMGEIYPTSVKAIALCFMDIFYSVIVILISKFFHWSNDTYGMHVPFFTFSCCCLLGLVFIVFYVPETKGKTLEDIQAELRGQKQKAAVRYVEGEKFY